MILKKPIGVATGAVHIAGMSKPIRIGVGGWTYEPWDESFYPADLTKKRQLEYVSRQLTAIEINGTFYRLQKPDTYKKWANETPPGFQFAVKAHNFCMSRKTVEDMKASIDKFIESGVTALGDRLGPINWQFPHTRKFDVEYFKAFLDALPKAHDEIKLRHAIEVRHESFRGEKAFAELLRKHECAIVFSDSEEWPQEDIESADFAYARLQTSDAKYKSGYPPKALDAWAEKLTTWAKKRETYAFFIAGAKETNPAAAMALIERLG